MASIEYDFGGEEKKMARTITHSSGFDAPRHPVKKPKLPLSLGGIGDPHGPRPTTTIYSDREQPDHQSGQCVAVDVPVEFADWIIRACNTHDDLVDALDVCMNAIDEAHKDPEAGLPSAAWHWWAAARAALSRARGEA